MNEAYSGCMNRHRLSLSLVSGAAACQLQRFCGWTKAGRMLSQLSHSRCLLDWMPIRVASLALGLLSILGHAQTIPSVVIPIVKERVPYYNIHENGKGVSCALIGG